jgi:hypothetical protein
LALLAVEAEEVNAFRFQRARLWFRAEGSIHFPAGKPGNILRGAFGTILRRLDPSAYSRIFEPRATGAGPSGLGDWPRPFVFRVAHLDGRTFQPGENFSFDLHVFDQENPTIGYFAQTFAELAREGLGPGRGRAALLTISSEPQFIPLQWPVAPVSQIEVRFVTPTELKPVSRPEFGVLLARARDRVSTLSALYGDGPLDLDFRGLGERAAAVRMTRCELQEIRVERVSSRTGQRHPLGGFVGVAEYEGDLAEFTGLLMAAQYTGVGRQTTWGKGEIKVSLK